MRKRYKLLFSALLWAGAAGAGEFDYLNGVSLGQPLPPHAMRFLERAPPPQPRLTLIDFWASWCVACIASIPRLNGWQQKFGADGLAVIGATQDQDQAVRRFLSKFPMDYAVGLAGQPALQELLRIRAMPYAILIDQAGIIIWRGQPEQLSDALLAHYLARQP